jgi:hypothetical protein
LLRKRGRAIEEFGDLIGSFDEILNIRVILPKHSEHYFELSGLLVSQVPVQMLLGDVEPIIIQKQACNRWIKDPLE